MMSLACRLTVAASVLYLSSGTDQSCLIQKRSSYDTGALASNGLAESRSDWSAKKQSVVGAYAGRNVTNEEVAQAVRELEMLGKSEEEEHLQVANISLHKALREQILTSLKSEKTAQGDQEAAAQQAIKNALASVLPRGASSTQPRRAMEFDGEWVLGADCTSCDDVCNRPGAQHRFCDVAATDSLNDNVSIAYAVEKAGFECVSSLEVPASVGKWDGPWWTGSGQGGQCGFSNGEFTDISCSAKPNCGYRRICACSSTNARGELAPKPGPFADIELSLKLGPDLLRPSDGGGQEMRAVVAPNQLQALGQSCLIYSFGAGYQTGYEKLMSDFGCRVHVFDCTMVDSPQHLVSFLADVAAIDNVIFHPWCVGDHGSQYHGAYGNAPSMFFTLDEIMSKLGHDSVDIVKFDIEGFEWKLFESLLAGKYMPEQIAFELHTYNAKPQGVPQELVKDKGRREVAQLFNQLYDKNYRVVSKDINQFDGACCEFVVVRI
mmetsp:Transcript_93238/g.179135  ORF Transcript_93238/g.179135 Transcript_93238/m.179135 type:complete len:492 (+) Transcript_93238:38-1513(+)